MSSMDRQGSVCVDNILSSQKKDKIRQKKIMSCPEIGYH